MPNKEIVSLQSFYDNNSDLIITYRDNTVAVDPDKLQKRCEELSYPATTQYTYRCPVDWTTWKFTFPEELRPSAIACPSAHDWEICTLHALQLVKTEEI